MPIVVDFAKKLAVVTGGGRGIGLAIANSLARGGAEVAITYTSQDATPVAATISKEHNTRVEAFKCEVTRSSEVNQTVQAIEAKFGKKVDIAIANAGISLWKDATETTDEDWHDVLATNTFGPYYLARALMRSWLNQPLTPGEGEKLDLRGMKGVNLDKQILMVSSISGIVAMSPQRQTAYNTSKGALTMMAKSLATEWAHLGVTVNSISPGYIMTDMTVEKSKSEPGGEAIVQEWADRTLVSRFGTPEDIGDACAMLVSNQMAGKGFMTGSDVVIDGGYTCF